MYAATQLERTRARSTDPETSHLAASSAKELAERHGRLILMCLQDFGPLGKDGIANHSSIDGTAVARRLPELKAAGLAIPTGNIVRSNTGRSEREWMAVVQNA